MAGEQRITVDNISFSYTGAQEHRVFEDISLEIPEGEVFSILGPNGTGKSTLLKCMAGLLSPDEGTVLLDGQRIHSMQPRERALKMAYVPQTQISPFPFPVRDIVLMGRAAHLNPFAVPSMEDEDRAMEALRQVGIKNLAHKSCNSISGGEWQLVLIARAITQNTNILLLDEPTSHLDLGNQMKVLSVIELLSEQGITIVIATHFPDHAFLNSGKVVVLKDRFFIAQGPPDEVIKEEVMKEAYGIDVSIIELGPPVSRKICVPLRVERKMETENLSFSRIHNI